MKKILDILLAFVIVISSFSLMAFAESDNLKFKDGEFKILVFSDTQDDQYPAYDMLNFVSLMIETAKPDLIVFTGDFVEDSRIGDLGIDDESFREGVVVKKNGETDVEATLKNIQTATAPVLEILQNSGIPFAIAMGNNDYKCSITNQDWLNIFNQYSNCLTTDMSRDAESRIDYNVEIKGSDGKTAFNIWIMDTGRSRVNSDQVQWYIEKSNSIKSANDGKAVPSFVFQHVQVDDIGNLFEECSIFDEGARAKDGKCYRLNRDIAEGYNARAYVPGKSTEEFTAWKNQGDVIGAYFGHQHVDGFCGKVDGIELGFVFGCEMAKIGPYGYRLITLHENDITNYDNEVYTYEGSVKKGNARFEKYEDSGYREYSNAFEKAIFSLINIFDFLKATFRGWLS